MLPTDENYGGENGLSVTSDVERRENIVDDKL